MFHAATTLTGMHFVTTTLMTIVLRALGYIQPSHLPLSELLKFVLFANLSIVGMNVSLMWNSVGFYQVSSCYNIFLFSFNNAFVSYSSFLLPYMTIIRLQNFV